MVRVVVGTTAAGLVRVRIRVAAMVVMYDSGAPSRCSTQTVASSSSVLNALRE